MCGEPSKADSCHKVTAFYTRSGCASSNTEHVGGRSPPALLGVIFDHKTFPPRVVGPQVNCVFSKEERREKKRNETEDRPDPERSVQAGQC